LNGSVAGKIHDAAGNPLAGANVVVLGTRRGCSSDIEGNFRLHHLTPGKYRLRVSMLGYGTTELEQVHVVADLTTRLEVLLRSSRIAGEEVTVVAERPLIRVDATAKTTTLSAEQINNLPVQDLPEILAAQANMAVLTGTPSSKAGYDIRGIDDIRMRGGRNNEVALMIDGVKVANPVFGGFATRLSNKAVRQLTVLAGGFSARYGNALSGVVNITTQDGREQWSGSLRYGSTQPFGLKELTDEAGRARNRQNFQCTLGGPIGQGLSFFLSGEGNLSTGDIYEFDSIVWDDYRRLHDDLDGDGVADTVVVLPSTREIIDGLRRGLPPDSIHPDLRNRWDEVRGPDGREINPLDQYRGWKGFGWNNSLNGFGKLTWELNSNMKLAASLLADQQYRQRNNRNGYYIYDPQGQTVQLLNSNKQTLHWTHILSQNSLYTLHLSRFYSQRRTRILRNYADPYRSDWWRFGADPDNLKPPDEYIPYLGEGAIKDPFENGAFYLVADNRWYDGDASSTWELRWDYSAHLGADHALEFGLQYDYIDLEYYAYQNISQLDPFPTIYHRFPQEGGAYLQMKSELDFLVLNLGTRLDYGYAGGEFWADPFDPLSEQTGGTDTLEYNPVVAAERHLKMSPRAGLAYPLTDETVLHFNFGHFFQFPNYRDLYRASNAREMSIKRGNIIGNPNLEPEKSVQYEIGLQHRFWEDYALKVNGWSKETTNQVGSLLVPAYSDEGGDNPFEYAVFVNNNSGSARGIDLSVEKRAGRYFSGSLQYTWSRAEVLQPTSWDGYWNGDTSAEGARQESLAPWDQTHVLRAILTWRAPDPRGWRPWLRTAVKGLQGSLYYLVESGRPYTPTVSGGAVVEPYSARWPSYRRLDLKLSKRFRLPSLRCRAGIEIRNLLDRKNPLTGYTRTGSAENPGTSSWYTLSSSYWDSRNNNNYGMPRNMHLFLELEF